MAADSLPPIENADGMNSASPDDIKQQMAWEVRRLVDWAKGLEPRVIQANIAELAGLPTTDLSNYKSGARPISLEHARALDEWMDGFAQKKGAAAFRRTSLGGTFEQLRTAYDTQKQIGHAKCDIFVSAPMAAVEKSEYDETRRRITNLVECLEKEVGWTAYYAGRDAPAADEAFWDVPRLAMKMNSEYLRAAKYFVLVCLQELRVPSSVFVEAGMALALGMPAIYFARTPEDLPYILKEVDKFEEGLGWGRAYTYHVPGYEEAEAVVRRHGPGLFPVGGKRRPRSVSREPRSGRRRTPAE